MSTVDLVQKAYSEESWGDLPNFGGNYINFGYWKKVADKNCKKQLTFSQRALSQEYLYLLIADKLNINTSDMLLEFGSGRGVGAVSIAKKYNPKQIIGLDITSKQVDIANTIHEKNLRNKLNISFLNLSLYKFLDYNIKVNKLYSIEAFQHVKNIKNELNLINKVLSSKGSLIITTYFLKKELSLKEILQNFPLARTHQEFWTSIDNIITYLTLNDFHVKNVESIGEHVFWGYEKWIRQKANTEKINGCSFVYNKYYNEGLIDYYIIEAEKIY